MYICTNFEILINQGSVYMYQIWFSIRYVVPYIQFSIQETFFKHGIFAFMQLSFSAPLPRLCCIVIQCYFSIEHTLKFLFISSMMLKWLCMIYSKIQIQFGVSKNYNILQNIKKRIVYNSFFFWQYLLQLGMRVLLEIKTFCY